MYSDNLRMKGAFRNILIVCYTIVIIASCKKGPITYEFEGNITDASTGTVIPGVEFELDQKILQNGAVTAGFVFAGETETNALGNYALSIERKKVTSFLMTYKKENYFTIEFEETSANVTTDGINTYDQEMEPKSWVQFDIENFGPLDSDHLRILTQDFREGCIGCAENKTYNYYGPLDTTITYLTTAGTFLKFTFINVVTGYSVIDSMYATPFDTSTYIFNY
ncbi:MAG: hypothetical protein ACPG21_12900 [Crocinitomicaceae bacterium]